LDGSWDYAALTDDRRSVTAHQPTASRTPSSIRPTRATRPGRLATSSRPASTRNTSPSAPLPSVTYYALSRTPSPLTILPLRPSQFFFGTPSTCGCQHL